MFPAAKSEEFNGFKIQQKIWNISRQSGWPELYTNVTINNKFPKLSKSKLVKCYSSQILVSDCIVELLWYFIKYEKFICTITLCITLYKFKLQNISYSVKMNKRSSRLSLFTGNFAIFPIQNKIQLCHHPHDMVPAVPCTAVFDHYASS